MERYQDFFKKDISEIQGIGIYKWNINCWKCGKSTPHASYIIQYLGIVRRVLTIGTIEALDKVLLKKYKFVKRVYNYSEDKTVIANVCTHCFIIQGNNFILDEIRNEKVGLNMVDVRIQNTLSNRDLPSSLLRFLL